MWVAGTSVKLTYTSDDLTPPWPPAEGDLLASPHGACYLIEQVRPSPSIKGRVLLRCTRLDKHACAIGEPGVWPAYGHRRRG